MVSDGSRLMVSAKNKHLFPYCSRNFRIVTGTLDLMPRPEPILGCVHWPGFEGRCGNGVGGSPVYPVGTGPETRRQVVSKRGQS